MAHFLKRHLRFWVRSFWGAVLFVIITLAVVVQLGRALFPVLNDYRSEMEQQLSTQLGAQVEVGNISAKWTGLRPRVTFTAVAVRNRDNEPVFQVEQVSAEVSLLSTLRDWRLGFRKVTFTGLSGVLAQNDKGRWWVQGLARMKPPPPLADDRPRFRDPVDIFLFGRRVELTDTRLTLLFRSGLSTELAIPHIRLENDAQFHRLAASFGVDQEQESLSLVVEGTGDPRDDARFNARGFLHLQRFPSAKVLAALGIRDDLLSRDSSAVADNSWRDDGRVTLSLWFQGTSSRGVSWNGEVAVEGSPLRPPAQMQWPESLQSRFGGSWEPQRGWQVNAAGMELSWADFTAPPLDMSLRGSFGGETELALGPVDLARWSAVAQRAGLLQGRALETIETLQPRGELRNVHILRRPADQGYFSLRGNIVDGQVGAWQGAPALTGVNGFVEASAFGGELRLRSDNGFVLGFPLLYEQPLSFRQAQGAVRWEIDMTARKVFLSSSLVKLANDEVSARGHFNLHLPLDRGGEPEMTLVVGVRQGHAGLHKTLVPRTAPEPLLQWLDRAVIGGDVSKAGFIYHGSLLKDATTAKVIQLRGHVANAEIAFDPAWPALEKGAGDLYLDDQALSVTSLSGALKQLEVTQGKVALTRLAGEGRGIRVEARVNGDSSDAKRLLAETPLREMGGEEVAKWQWQGPLEAQLDVLVPLERERSDAARQKVQLQFGGNRLQMPDLNLTFDEVNGQLTYDSTTGLSSSGIDARLWGAPAQATMRTEPAGDGRTLIVSFRGRADVADVQEWTRRPELSFVSGSSPVTGELRVPMGGRSPMSLSLASTLEGVSLAALPPFQKSAAEELPLRILIERQPGNIPLSRYSFALNEIAELRWESIAGQMQAGALSLAKTSEPLQPGFFQIRGPLAQADAFLWRDVIESYVAALKANESPSALAATSGEVSEPLPIRVDLRVGVLNAGDLQLEDVGVKAAEDGGTWRLELEHTTLAGRVIWSPGDAPLQVDLDRLYLPGKAPPTEVQPLAEGDDIVVAGDPFTSPTEDFWRNLDLASVPALDIQVADLRNGATVLGRWALKLRPIERGLMAYDLTADTVGLAIGGRGKPGAELVWTRTPSGDSSYFSGVIRAGNLADTFRQLNLEPALSSDSAMLDVDLQWPGPPVDVDLLELAGVVELSVERGVFSRGGSVGENPLLKLIGLLNFDTLARRLRLDFSDLGAAGLAYEEINGALLFRSGIVQIRQPLQVSTPSSHLQLVGDLNMAQETLDTQLVATLPLAGNLTVAAALTGGVPLAIGVYVAGKIFKDQVERVSSLRYNVTGNWNDPEAKLERIFENTVADPPGTADSSAGGTFDP